MDKSRWCELQKTVEEMAKSRASFNYEANSFDANEKPLFDEDDHSMRSLRCQMDETYTCEACQLKDTMETQALDWEKKIHELVDQDWKKDMWHYIDQYFDIVYGEEPPDMEHLIEIQRRIFIFEHTDTFAENVTDFWSKGLPINAKQSLSDLRTLVASEMTLLDKCYNWEKAIDFLSIEIEREHACIALHNLDLH